MVGACCWWVLFPGKCIFVKRLISMPVRVKARLVLKACIVVKACIIVKACTVVRGGGTRNGLLQFPGAWIWGGVVWAVGCSS